MASIAFAAVLALGAQEQAPPPTPPAPDKPEAKDGWKKADEAKPDVSKLDEFVVPAGTKVPLSMINSISTKTAAEGERIYLETVFPILAGGHIVIPPGSYVAGTVTAVKRPGRVHGRGELYIRFDSLTLPNGVTRDFRARMGSLDGTAPETLDKAEGKIKSEGNKGGDLKTVGEAAGVGATVGGLAGAASGHAGMGAGIGAAAGATAGLIGVLLTRGPEAILAKGTTMEMVLDRPLQFTNTEIDFGGPMQRSPTTGGPAPRKSQSSYPGRRFPL
jgi:type IV secretion system protein VirB10